MKKTCLKISKVVVYPKQIYDTYTGSILVGAKVNDVDVVFPFTSNHGRYAVDGVDCDECYLTQLNSNGRYDSSANRIGGVAEGGSAKSYALSITENTLKSEPNKKQKDTRFTGLYYKTIKMKNAFKEIMKELFEDGSFNKDFLEAVNLV